MPYQNTNVRRHKAISQVIHAKDLLLANETRTKWVVLAVNLLEAAKEPRTHVGASLMRPANNAWNSYTGEADADHVRVRFIVASFCKFDEHCMTNLVSDVSQLL